MEYYCIMVKTGEEQIFKERAFARLKGKFPNFELFFFRRTLRSNKGEYFERPLFPGYVFLSIEKLTSEFFLILKQIKGFCRILQDNSNPTEFTGTALEQLKLFIRNGEHWGVSKVKILPGMKIQAVSGPFEGLEGYVYKINRKKKQITIISSLTENAKYIDLMYEDAEEITQT